MSLRLPPPTDPAQSLDLRGGKCDRAEGASNLRIVRRGTRRGSNRPGYLAKPAAGSGLPAVLLVPAISDLKGAVLETARDIAAHGFVALAVDYDPEHVSQESDLVQSVGDEQLSARLTAAVEWLARQRPLVDPQRIGAIGWDGGSARILKLAQQGQIHAGVMIESERCAAPENLPAVPAAPMLLIIGGCTPERGQELTGGTAGAYHVELAPAWSEIYKFLDRGGRIRQRLQHLQPLS